MGFLSTFKKAWQVANAEKKWKKAVTKKPISTEMEREKAARTARGEPWVGIIRMDVDPRDLDNGAFELDWNDIFVARLVKAGYSGKDDRAIVDMWFKNICAGVVNEVFEQEMADPEKRRMSKYKELENFMKNN